MPTNKDRAKAALKAIKVSTDYKVDDMPKRNKVAIYGGDLIANLMHLCHQENVDFAECLERGKTHFEAEKGK